MMGQKIRIVGIGLVELLLGCGAHSQKCLERNITEEKELSPDSAEVVPGNTIETLEDLRAAYLQLHFISGYSRDEGYPSANISLGTAQTIDEWLQDKLGIEKIVQEIDILIHIHDGGFGSSAGVEYEGLRQPFFLNRPIYSISVAERDIDTSGFIRNITSPSQVLDHEFIHAQDHYVGTADERLVYKNEADRSETLEQKYIKAAVESANNLYQDPEFLTLLGEVGDIGYPARIINYVVTVKDFIGRTESAEVRRATILFDIGQGLETSDDPKSEALLKRWNSFLEEKTGLYSYSYCGPAFKEMSATYAELPTERARKNKKLAQLEFDRVMSIDNAPQWLKEQAAKRYYDIMGGENGLYCSRNECGPCLGYTLTCKTE